MSAPLRLALAQLNAHVGNLDGNADKVVAAIQEARRQGANLVLFPELMLTGYPPEDLLFKGGFLQAARRKLDELRPHTHGITVVIGFPELADDVYNSAAVLHDGRLAGIHRKWFLPNYGVFDEDRYFRAGTAATVFERADVRFGAVVCEDLWSPDGPARPMTLWGGAQLIAAINASPFELGKGERRHAMLAARAMDHLAAFAYVNLVGGQDELVFDGRSMLVGPDGEPLVTGPAFDEAVLVADVDVAAIDHARRQTPRRRAELADQSPPPGLSRVILSPALVPDMPLVPSTPAPHLDDDALAYKALVTGVRDYVTKNGFPGVAIGLSGGIDSALVAAIAVDALGPERVRGVYMPGPYSADISGQDAAELATNLNVTFDVLPIAPMFSAFKESLAEVFSGQAEDVTEENLQARARGTLLMAIANKFKLLVLTTGNKSELATGYGTLYGDMAGGFAPIRDVPKTMVFRLCRWRNQQSPAIPERTITRPPSAELRPDQKDSDSLPEYDLLDPILQAYVEDDRSLAEIAAMGYDVATVRRVMRLVDLNEYKRRQAATGPKITGRSFGRDRRLPMTNAFRDVT